jgi:hypothetical protein
MVQEVDAPTLDEIPAEVVSEVQELLSELDASSRSVEPGEEVGSADLMGMKIKRTKTSSMVHMGGRPLPERVTVFDAKGMPSRVPTAQIGYHLSKTDRSGNRVFFSKPPPGVKQPEPIDETCPICLERGVRKKFYSRYAHRQHMVILHPLEFQMMREDKEEARAREGLIDQLRRMTLEERQQLAAVLAVQPAETSESPEVFRCQNDGCERFFDTERGRDQHQYTCPYKEE